MGSATNTATNILGTTAAGATIGSLVPVVGTAIGAGVGAAVGIGSAVFDWAMSQGASPEEAAAQARAYDSTFVATPAMLERYDFASAIAEGRGGAAGARGQQQVLADALLARAQGQGGPSLAELQLQEATDRNSALAAGLVASQRGINPGMAARLGAQAQGTANQAAAGQAAQIRAQEQIAAQSALAQQLATMRGQDLGLMGQGASGLGTQNQQALQNALGTQGINADTATANANRAAGVNATNLNVAESEANRAERMTGAFASGAGSAGMARASAPAANPNYVDSDNLTDEASLFAAGGMVPGRARRRGDSYENDVVPAELSPGEIVLPRSITMSDDAPALAAAFVAEIRRKHQTGDR